MELLHECQNYSKALNVSTPVRLISSPRVSVASKYQNTDEWSLNEPKSEILSESRAGAMKLTLKLILFSRAFQGDRHVAVDLHTWHALEAEHVLNDVKHLKFHAQ